MTTLPRLLPPEVDAAPHEVEAVEAFRCYLRDMWCRRAWGELRIVVQEGAVTLMARTAEPLQRWHRPEEAEKVLQPRPTEPDNAD